MSVSASNTRSVLCEGLALVCGSRAIARCSGLEALGLIVFRSLTPLSTFFPWEEEGGSHFTGRLVREILGGGLRFWGWGTSCFLFNEEEEEGIRRG